MNRTITRPATPQAFHPGRYVILPPAVRAIVRARPHSDAPSWAFRAHNGASRKALTYIYHL